MKINAKGSVTFSVRNNDQDLRAFFEGLPEGTGSDIIRALVRDGLAYQQTVEGAAAVTASQLQLLCALRRIDVDSILAPYFDDTPLPVVKKVAKPTPAPKEPEKAVEDVQEVKETEATEKEQVFKETEAIEKEQVVKETEATHEEEVVEQVQEHNEAPTEEDDNKDLVDLDDPMMGNGSFM